MDSFVALIRGINVGGKSMIPMADLRLLLDKAGFSGVKTLLQSGNVVFKSDAAAKALEIQLEKVAANKFARPVDFFVREKAAWEKIVAKNPFSNEAKNDPRHLVVLCLKDAPAKAALSALEGAIVGREYFEPGDRCLYLVYPDGIGTSRLTSAVLEKKLGTKGTARNWNTVVKIAATL